MNGDGWSSVELTTNDLSVLNIQNKTIVNVENCGNENSSYESQYSSTNNKRLLNYIDSSH